jgi:NAD(P)-dependent dehydrogenase (short-subunit alcohol dehydrogenase family)
MAGKLEGKVGIVTGAGSGIGKAIAKIFAAKGASVVISDIILERAISTGREIVSSGGIALAVKTDVSDRNSVRNMIEETINKFKKIDILVNNAGIARRAPFAELTDEEWDAELNVDLKGVFHCSQAALPYMKEHRYGKIINISSMAGTGLILTDQAAYVAAKAGVNQLTKVLAKEGGPYNINSNAIAPGIISGTAILSATISKEALEASKEASKQAALLRRVGTVDDIANLALFLASEDSSFITGQIIRCDGGRSDFM